MRNNITNADGVQRFPLVKTPTPILTTTINPAVETRDSLRRSDPTASFGLVNNACDRTVFFLAPGQGIDRNSRKSLERQFRTNIRSRGALASIEFEFSPAANKVRGDEGLPEDFRPSLLRWALKHSGAVIIAVTDTPEGAEPSSILHSVQTVIRCSEANVNVWGDYLGRRVRPRQRFAVVRLDALAVQS